jgi:vacuole morphology and inheritance protein 14
VIYFAGEFETRVAFRPMVETLISQTAREKDKFNRLTAVEWLTQFILLGRARLAPVYDRLLATVLRCLSDPEAEIVNEATKANNELIQLVRSTAAADFQDTFLSILKTVTTEARAKDRITRSAALRWSAMLLAVSPERVFGSVDDLLASLLNNLLDSDDADVLRLNVRYSHRHLLTLHDNVM